jgi:hypothetical protein
MHNIDPLTINRMIGEWIFLFILFLIFLINLYVLVPKFLFKDKRSRYVIMLSLIIFTGIVADVLLHKWHMPREITSIPDRPHGFTHNTPLAEFSLLGAVFNNLIVSFLIIGSSTAFELFYKLLNEEKKTERHGKRTAKNQSCFAEESGESAFFYEYA